MSGSTDQANEPTDNAEWARSTDARLSALETPSSLRAGQWVISESDDGNLIASYATGGSRVLATKPTEGENDPDAIEDPDNPSVCVTRTTAFTVPANPGGVIRFDGASSENGGNWTGGKNDFESVIVPIAGTYWVSATVHSVTNSNAKFVCVIRVNSIGVAAGAFPALDGDVVGSTSFASGTGSHSHGAGSLAATGVASGMSSTASRIVELNAGDAIDVWVVNVSGSTFNIGTNANAPNSPPTTLSAMLATKKE